MKLFLTLFMAIITAFSFGQSFTGKISLEVLDDKNKGIDNASAYLLKAKDSSVHKTSLSDKNGRVEFDNVPVGQYIIKVSSSGFKEKYAGPVEVSEGTPAISLSPVNLQIRSKELTEVTVSARKPFLQRLNDRLIVNVENSIVNAGSTAFEVLERSPGVTIDPNDVIGLKGKQGVIIMIDGKPSPMSGADLLNYLRGLPSSSLDRIEIITNPSSKYDAAGNSGIIDFRMKKDQRVGTNGSVTAGYGQGVFPKANAGISLNHRNKKMNVFGSYNYAFRKNLNHLFLDRNFYDNGVFNGSDLKDNYSRAPFAGNNFRVGADFFPSKKTIIGFVVNSNFNHFTRNNDNNSIVIDNQHQPAYTFQTIAHNNDHNKNYIANINLKHNFNSSGREITADVDYGQYNSKSLSTTSTKYYSLSGGTQQPDYILWGDQKGKITFKTAKADFTNPLKKGAALEAGIKTSFVSTDNDAVFFDASNGIPQNDVNKTNHFLYDENNNAAYVNFKKDFKKINFQVGLRAEQTNVKTYQEIGKVNWDSSYIQLFPTAFLNYKIKEDQTLGVSVSRRIDRPGYGQLNPFLFLIDVTTYASGNPALLPQFTWSYELNYTLKNINIALNYSKTSKSQTVVIARFKDIHPGIPQDDNVTIQIPVNLSSTEHYGLSVSAPVKVNKWWNMINNADVYYNHYNGKLGSNVLNNGKPAADVRVNNSFTITNGWGAELNGSFNSGGQYGFMVLDPQWGISAGVQKTVLKKKGTVKLNVTDIFWTNLPKAVITYGNYIEKWHAQRESRVATLSFTYRFGKNTIQAARRRTTASEEERQRAGN